MGSKTKEIKKRGLEIDLRLGQLFDLCDFDLGRVNCICFQCIKSLKMGFCEEQRKDIPSYAPWQIVQCGILVARSHFGTFLPHNFWN